MQFTRAVSPSTDHADIYELTAIVTVRMQDGAPIFASDETRKVWGLCEHKLAIPE
jgi:hypothetical protein